MGEMGKTLHKSIQCYYLTSETLPFKKSIFFKPRMSSKSYRITSDLLLFPTACFSVLRKLPNLDLYAGSIGKTLIDR